MVSQAPHDPPHFAPSAVPARLLPWVLAGGGYALPTRVLIAGNSYTYLTNGLNSSLEALLEAKGFAGMTFIQYASDQLSTSDHANNGDLLTDLGEGVSHFIIQWLSLEGCKPDLRPDFLDNISTLAGYAFAGNPDCRIILHCPPAYAPGTAAIASNGFADWEDMWEEQIAGMDAAYARIRADYSGNPAPVKIDNNRQIRAWGAYLVSGASFNDFHDSDGMHNTWQRMGSFACNIATGMTGLNFEDVANAALGPSGSNLLLESLTGQQLAHASYYGQIRRQYRPLITVQPVTQAVADGAPVTLTVTVEANSVPATYQWKKGGVAINGATSSSYAIGSYSDASHAGSYTCEVSNAVATATSGAGVLTLYVASVTAFKLDFAMNGSGAETGFTKISSPSDNQSGVTANVTTWAIAGTTYLLRYISGTFGANNNGITGVLGTGGSVSGTHMVHTNSEAAATFDLEGLPVGAVVRIKALGCRANDGASNAASKLTCTGVSVHTLQWNARVTPGAMPSEDVTVPASGKIRIAFDSDTGNTAGFSYLGWAEFAPPP